MKLAGISGKEKKEYLKAKMMNFKLTVRLKISETCKAAS